MKKDVEVRHCRTLIAVHDWGGVGAAARILGVAQSTVSETLLSLERLLDLPVTIRRTGREALLTSTAETLIPFARALVAASEAVSAATAPHKAATIRLGTVESISSFLLPGPLAEFRNQSPDINVRIAIGLCEELRGRVDRLELDAALTIEGGEQDAAFVACEDLLTVRLLLVVSPNHPLVGTILARHHLVNQICLLTDPEGAFIDLVESWIGNAERPPRFESAGSVDGVKRGVAQGTAIGILPEYAVADELEAGLLVALQTGDPLPQVTIRLKTSDAVKNPTDLDGLIQKIRERFRGSGLSGEYQPTRIPS
jgi:DNA-binding transcriptional LysR family regulator